MKKNKGFTLVELLAVIAILAILVLLSLPNIIKVFNQAKKNTFLDEVQIIYKETTSKYISESLKGNNISKISSKDDSKLNLTGEDMDYCVLLNNKGEVDKIAVGNSNYHLVASNVTGIESLKIDEVLDGNLENMNCDPNSFKVKINCKVDGTLSNGLKYTNGQYIYSYSDSLKGWGVSLKDINSTDPITTPFCATINDKPIVIMTNLFNNSQATSIDLSSFDTSKVTVMYGMFMGSHATTLDLSSFDTSKVINMYGMFMRSKATSIDLSSFDTSNVTDMDFMFSGSQATSLDLSNFDTSNVTNMISMFSSSAATTLDLSSFDTSKVTNMRGMFNSSQATSINLNSFNTSNVTDMGAMFFYSKATSLDLSSFDTSKVTDIMNMFYNIPATTGYARTQTDANNFNSSYGKPTELNFIVK